MRAYDLEQIDDWWHTGGRLLSLIGPPGVGKSHLLRRALVMLEGRSSLTMIDLSACLDRRDFVGAVATALGLELRPEHLAENLEMHIAGALHAAGPTLLALDNFEQLTHSTSELLDTWLTETRQLRILLTSQVPPDTTTARIQQVAPLNIEDAQHLFIELYQRRFPGKVLTDEEHAPLTALVQRLNGLPLAIELAVARTRLLGIRGLARRADRQLDMLGNHVVGTAARHHTMRQAIDWSWSLLSEHERRALAQCAAFRGGFDLEAAEAVIDVVDGPIVVDTLQNLHERSLLTVDDLTGRFSLLSSIREFAYEQLRAMNIKDSTSLRHARHYAQLGRELTDALDGPHGTPSRRQLRAERYNLLAMLEDADDHPPEWALCAALAISPVLSPSPGPMPEMTRSEEALTALCKRASGAIRAHALIARGRIHQLQGRLGLARDLLSKAHQEARAAGDKPLEALATVWMATNCWQLGEIGRAEELAADAAELFFLLEDLQGRALALGQLALARHDQGLRDSAITTYIDALQYARQCGSRGCEVRTLLNLARLLGERGRPEEAIERLKQALQLAREAAQSHHEAIALTYLLHFMAQSRTHDDEFEDIAQQALELHRVLVYSRGEASLRGALATWLIEHQKLDEARTELLIAQTIAIDHSDARGTASHRVPLGLIAWEQGRLKDALDYFELARDFFDDSGDLRLESVVSGFIAIIHAERGHTDDASKTLLDARHLLSEEHTQCRGFLDLCAAHCRLQDHDEPSLDAHKPHRDLVLDTLTPFLKERASLLDASMLARRVVKAIAANLTDHERRALVERVATRDGETLILDLNARAARIPDGRWVEFAASALLWNLIETLARRARAMAPPIEQDDLIEALWPSEQMSHTSATNRLHKSLSTLRRKGFKNLIERQDEGYTLVSELHIITLAEIIGL